MENIITGIGLGLGFLIGVILIPEVVVVINLVLPKKWQIKSKDDNDEDL